MIEIKKELVKVVFQLVEADKKLEDLKDKIKALIEKWKDDPDEIWLIKVDSLIEDLQELLEDKSDE